MVFESVFANLLNTYLSEFIDDLSANQLKLGAFKGNVELQNLAVKENAFDKLNLPFRVIHGHVGKLIMKIPWMSIYTSPVIIKLQNVFVLAVPNVEAKYDPNYEEAQAEAAKLKQLADIEEAVKKQALKNITEQNKEASQDDFVTKVVAQVIKNIEITIENVHIRYEDKFSYPRVPFAVGLTLSQLIFQTPNTETSSKNKNGDKDNKFENRIYKITHLRFLSLYWNCGMREEFMSDRHADATARDELLADAITAENKPVTYLSYILEPINFHANAEINRKPQETQFKTPLFDLDLNLDQLSFSFKRLQFESLVMFLDSLNRMSVASTYRRWRPQVPIRGNARAWWKFAITSVLETEIRRKCKAWEWKHIKQHRSNVRRYQELHKKRLLKLAMSKDEVEEIKKLEKQLDVFNIVLARNEADIQARAQRKKDEANKPPTPEKKGWFSWVWGESAKDKEAQKEQQIMEQFKSEITPAEKLKFYQAIGYEEAAPPVDYPPEFVAHLLRVCLKMIRLSVMDDLQDEKILQLTFTETQARIDHRPASNGLTAVSSIKSLLLTGAGGTVLADEECEDQNLLTLKFDLNPVDKRYDYGIDLAMDGIKFLYDAATVNTLVEIISPPSDVSLEQIQSLAAIKLKQLKHTSVSGLEFAIEKHKQIHVNLNIEPSFVLVPNTGSLYSCHHILVLCLGKANIASQLINKKDLNLQERDEAKLKVMREKAYEKYMLSIAQVQVILSDNQHWKEDIVVKGPNEELSNRHLIRPIALNLTVMRSIILDDPEIPKLKVTGNIPELYLRASDEQICNLINLATNMPLPNQKPPQDPDTVSLGFESTSVTQAKQATDALIAVDNIQKQVDRKDALVQLTELTLKFVIGGFVIDLRSSDHKEVVILSLKDIGTKVDMKTFSLAAEFYLQQIAMEQRSYSLLNTSRSENLLLLNYEMNDQSAPTFKNVVQKVTIKMSQIEVSASYSVLVEILAWVQLVTNNLPTSTAALKPPEEVAPRKRRTSSMSSLPTIGGRKAKGRGKGGEIKNLDPKTIINLMTQFEISKLTLNIDGICTAEFTGLNCELKMFLSERLTLSAHWKDFKIINRMVDEGDTITYPHIVKSESAEVLELSVVMYSKKEIEEKVSDVDLLVKVHFGRLAVVFLNKFVMELLEFLSLFEAAKAKAIAASSAAADYAKQSAMNAYESLTKLGLDVIFEAPNVIVPRSSKSLECLLVNLGNVKLKNSIATSRTLILDTITCELTDTKVTYSKSGESTPLDDILMPISFGVTIKRNLTFSQNTSEPEINISGVLRNIQLRVSQGDLTLLMRILSENLGDSAPPLASKSEQTAPNKTTSVAKRNDRALAPATGIQSSVIVEEAVVHVDAANEEARFDPPVHAKFKFDFTMHGIRLALYDGAVKLPTNQLCDFHLTNLEAFGVIQSNNTIQAGVALSNITLLDIRNGAKLMYAKLNTNPESGMDGVMLRVSFTQQDDIFVDVHMSGFVFILAVDFILKVSNVVTSALSPPETFTMDSQLQTRSSGDSMRVHQSTPPSQLATSTVVNVQPSPNNMLLVVNFRMSQMDVILMESANTKDCSSVILNCLVEGGLKQRESCLNISGKVTNVQLAITNFQRYQASQEIDAYILKPTEVCFHLAIDEAQSQHIDVVLSDIKFHISPNTVQALLSILSSISAPESRELDTAEEEKQISAKTIFHPKKLGDPNKYWYLKREEVVIGVEATEDDPSQNAASPFLIKHQLVVTASSVSLTIESGGIDSRPLLRLETSLTGRFDNWKHLDLHCSTYMEYYNIKRYVWEPLIDILEGNRLWSFDLLVDINENSDKSQTYMVKLQSQERLELTMTKTAMSVLTSLQEAFNHAVKKSELVGSEEIVKVSNYLGVNLVLFVPETKFICMNSEMVSRAIDGTQVIQVKPSQSIQLKSTQSTAGNEAEVDVVDLHFKLVSESFEIEKKISLLGTEKRCYNLPVDSGRGEEWKYTINMSHEDFQTKIIVFHSNVEIFNKFSRPLELYNIRRDERVAFVGQVQSMSSFYVPLALIYKGTGKIYVKPAEDYCVPKHGLDWRSVPQGKPTYYNYACESKTHQPDFFIRVKQFREQLLYEETNSTHPESTYYRFELLPTFKLRNLLPFPVRYSLANIDEQLSLLPGAESDMCYADLRDTTLTVYIEDYLGENWISTKKLPPRWAKEDLVEVWTYKTMDIASPEQVSVDLAMNYSTKEESGIRVASVFSPFWMINKTGLNVSYRVGDTIIQHEKELNEPILICFKPKTLFSKKKLSLAFEDSKFSDSFSIDAVGNTGNVIAKGKDKSSYCATIDITLSSFGLTKIVTVCPFYSIQNKTTIGIQVSDSNENWVFVKPKSVHSLWPKSSKDTKLYFRLDPHSPESQPISIEDTDSTLLTLGDEVIYVHVDVTDSSVTVQVTNYFKGAAPLRIINGTKDLTVDYGQFMLPKRNRLHPMSSVYFTWHEPSLNRVFIWSTTESPELTLELEKDAIGEAVHDESGQNSLYWVCFLDAKQRILLITRDAEVAQNALHAGELTKPLYEAEVRLRGIGISLVDNDVGQELIYIGISSSGIVWEVARAENKRFKPLSVKQSELLEQAFQKEVLRNKVSDDLMVRSSSARLKSVALSTNFKVDLTDLKRPILLEPSKGILRRSSTQGFWCMLSMSEHVVQLHLKINRIQIDNQMDNCIFGIIMCPVTPPKSISQDRAPKSFIELSALIQRQAQMNRFKYLCILIQEFLIQIDGDFLIALMNFFSDTKRVAETNYEKLIEIDLKRIFANPISDQEVALSKKNYYDHLHFSPIKVHVSFALGEFGSFDILGELDFLIKSAGVTLTEFKDVVFRIDYFERRNSLLSDDELTAAATSHYIRQVLKQFYVVVLGLDVIGNPVGLFLGLKQGVGDFFYEPVAGMIEGPEEFAEGLALGVRSLFSHTVGGAAGALGKITGTLGEGISSLTMDDADKRRRRAILNKKPSFAQSGKNLAKGFFLGATGIFTKPYQGAKNEGFEGMLKGMGRGVVGVVAQPATGVIDFASGSLNALQRAVDINAEAKKQRPPRYIAKDGIVRSYNVHDATGAALLNELNKSHAWDTDTYVSHFNLVGDAVILITDRRLFYLKHPCMSRAIEIDWTESYDNILGVDIVDSTAVKLQLKEQTRKLGGLVSGGFERILFCPSPEVAKRLTSTLVLRKPELESGERFNN